MIQAEMRPKSNLDGYPPRRIDFQCVTKVLVLAAVATGSAAPGRRECARSL
jgi:hypothetical protein